MSDKLKRSNWWNENLYEGSEKVKDFKDWIADFDQPTKNYCRKYVIGKKYKSILDCGSGLGAEYYGYQSEGSDIAYTGLDSCEFLIAKNQERGIDMVQGNLEDELPTKDKQFDVVYCKAVLEHLTNPYKALSEFVRSASKEVIIGWFIKPDDEPANVNYWEQEGLYHNKYNKKEIEDFLMAMPRVKELKWHEIDDKENVLHILLKK